jgi:hypothetical protein
VRCKGGVAGENVLGNERAARANRFNDLLTISIVVWNALILMVVDHLGYSGADREGLEKRRKRVAVNEDDIAD